MTHAVAPYSFCFQAQSRSSIHVIAERGPAKMCEKYDSCRESAQSQRCVLPDYLADEFASAVLLPSSIVHLACGQISPIVDLAHAA